MPSNQLMRKYNMNDERRAFPRAPGVLDGTWFGSGQRCRITSLSVKGCYIESLTPPEKSVRVRVQLELPQQGPVSVHGEVAYREPSMGFAIRFLDVTQEDHEKLAQAVDFLVEPSALLA